MCIYVYIYIYIYVYINLYRCIHIHAYMYTYICIYESPFQITRPHIACLSLARALLHVLSHSLSVLTVCLSVSQLVNHSCLIVSL